MANIIRRDSIDDILRGFFVRPVGFSGHDEVPQIKVDIQEENDAFRIHAELPGVKKEDVHVSIDGPLVSISAERKVESEGRGGDQYLRRERYFGKVSRSFQLAQEVDEATTTAKLTDGILDLRLPKKTVSPARRITVE